MNSRKKIHKIFFFANSASASSLSLRCDTLYQTTPGQDFKIAELIAHPSYSSWTLDNDIGLIRINGQFTLGSTNLNKIDLPAQDSDPPAGAIVKITGWGTTSEGSSSLPTTLKTVDVPIVARDKCRQNYQSFNDITEQMFCAGVDNGGKDACQVCMQTNVHNIHILIYEMILREILEDPSSIITNL